MNILISSHWIREYLQTDVSIDEFARLTTKIGNSVERTHRFSERFQNMVVGVVQKIEAHPQADRLRVVKTDIGGSVVDIVCGGINLTEGQKVAVALPGACVRWHGEGELVTLEETTIRGVKSCGMICAADEIGFEHLSQPAGASIWDISGLTDAVPGTSLTEALDLEDVIFDIEVTTNRPDCMSIVGQAREGSAAVGGTFVWNPPLLSKTDAAPVSVKVEDPKLCPRYQAIRIEGVKVGPSPWWLQKRLLLAGYRPINNVVDVTNYVLHEYGHPLHTFDADKLVGGKIFVRHAKLGERLMALDGKEYVLDAPMLVIADEAGPAALAGIMGGVRTGTTEETVNIILESAVFDAVSIRTTSRNLNLASDASKLFEKALSTEATESALARAVELVLQLAGGRVASDVADVCAAAYQPLHFSFDSSRVQKLIGVEIPEKIMTDILERLGFRFVKLGGALGVYEVTVPYWRDHDIEASVDFVEEIARVYGYDKLPSILPSGQLHFIPKDPGLIWERRIKEWLRGAGFTEAYSYSFVSKKQMEDYGMNVSQVIRLANPLSLDQEYMRPSLIPSLLTVLESNQRSFSSMRLFELASVYSFAAEKGGLPDQRLRLLLAVSRSDGGQAFLEAKGALERLFVETGIHNGRLKRDTQDSSLWHPGRVASILVQDAVIGTIGEISPEKAKNFGLEGRVVLVDLDFENLLPFFSTTKTYEPMPDYPEVKRDIAFVVDRLIEYEKIKNVLTTSSVLLKKIDLFDVYVGSGIPEGKKSMAFHLSFRDPTRTLSSEEVDVCMAKVRKAVEEEFGAVIRA